MFVAFDRRGLDRVICRRTFQLAFVLSVDGDREEQRKTDPIMTVFGVSCPFSGAPSVMCHVSFST